MTMEYQQVKERVEKEDKALKQIFILSGPDSGCLLHCLQRSSCFGKADDDQ